jgi:hypothetical protein
MALFLIFMFVGIFTEDDLLIWIEKIDNSPIVLLEQMIVTALSMLILIPLSHKLFGNTLGKKLFGIEVCNADGTPLSFYDSFSRERLILVKGLFFGIGFIAFFTMLNAYKKLLSKGTTSWDKKLKLCITYKEKNKIFLTLKVIMIGSALLVLNIISLMLKYNISIFS